MAKNAWSRVGAEGGGGGAVFEVYTSFKMFSFLSKERG